MDAPKRIALTGAPGTGKTSLITSLEKQGHYCLNEYSRQVIGEQMQLGTDVLPWANLDAFSKLLIEKRKEQFFQPPPNIPLAFFDRTLMDSFAYMIKSGIPIAKADELFAKKNRFDKVFLFPVWEQIYETDEHRWESLQEAKLQEEFFVKSYQQFGYELIVMPKTTIEERIDYIKKHL